MSWADLIDKAIEKQIAPSIIALILLARGLRGLWKWGAANYWPKYCEWKELRMRQEAAAEIRQAEMIATAFKQIGEMHSQSMQQAAQHELSDERRHHVLVERLEARAEKDRHDIKGAMTELSLAICERQDKAQSFLDDRLCEARDLVIQRIDALDTGDLPSSRR